MAITSEEIKKISERVITERKGISREEAELLMNYPDLDFLCDEADKITRALQPKEVDSCSIVNARSGLCGEDCKWCAQSRHYSTGCESYEFLPYEDTLRAARHNEKEGIRRFSLVTSGRNLSEKSLEEFCRQYRRLSAETDLYLCASMGLLSRSQMQALKDAGVKRYHCNMETSRKVFKRLCTTHSPEDKLLTISHARDLGMDICSGGIIGMGETNSDRLDFAFELAELNPDSVPINILNPIPGTPLESTPLISEEEIIRTAAIFRFILPCQSIRFAGGRMRLSDESMRRMMRGGVNGVLMGDMLTTVSNQIADDRKLFADSGWIF
ncbi:MAG: biotin synthase BioB [Muribaculaceae bacterium]|nr:biotin synthase BioB [Muribaculaceae bacterium]